MKEDRFKNLSEERFTSWADNGKACSGCMFSKGEPPFADDPSKGSCMIYAYPRTKPDRVYLDGKECKYYREK